MAAKRTQKAIQQPAAAPSLLLTLQETATRLGGGFTKVMVRKEIARGRLKALRVGGRRIGVRPEHIEEYLRDRESEGVHV